MCCKNIFSSAHMSGEENLVRIASPYCKLFALAGQECFSAFDMNVLLE